MPYFYFSGDLKSFEKIQKLDEEYCSTVQEMLQNTFEFNMGIGKIQPDGVKNIRIAGSTAEGTALARLFRRNDLFPDGLNREIEADYEFILFEIPENLKNHVEDLRGNKTGFLNLRVDLELLKLVKELGWKIEEEELMSVLYHIAPNGHLLPYRLKETYLNKQRFIGSNRFIEIGFAYVLNKKRQDVSFTHVQENIKKSSVKLEGIVNIKSEPYLALSFDIVQLIKLNWWPEIATEWKTRERDWPKNQRVINELTKESFIIGKPTHDQYFNYDTDELRYSFSHVETRLVEMRSRFQNMTYLIFKCMIYKWLSSVNGRQDEIKSFVAKTVMFWVCEANNKEDKTFWKEDFHSLLDIIRHLFTEMSKYFEAGFMPYYFIPKINVIESIPLETRNQVIQKIQAILQNIEYHLPLLSEIEEWTFEVIGITKSLLKLTVDLCHQNWISIFLRNPDIAAENIKLFLELSRLDQSAGDIQIVFNQFQEEQKVGQCCNLFNATRHH